mgnify:CR=1 FL=1
MNYLENLNTEALILLKEFCYDEIFEIIRKRYKKFCSTIIYSFYKNKYGTIKGFEEEVENMYVECLGKTIESYDFSQGVFFKSYFTKCLRYFCTANISRKDKDFLLEKFPDNDDQGIVLGEEINKNTPAELYEGNELKEKINTLINSNIRIEGLTFREALHVTIDLSVRQFLEEYPNASSRMYYYVTTKVRSLVMDEINKTK